MKWKPTINSDDLKLFFWLYLSSILHNASELHIVSLLKNTNKSMPSNSDRCCFSSFHFSGQLRFQILKNSHNVCGACAQHGSPRRIRLVRLSRLLYYLTTITTTQTQPYAPREFKALSLSTAENEKLKEEKK